MRTKSKEEDFRDCGFRTTAADGSRSPCVVYLVLLGLSWGVVARAAGCDHPLTSVTPGLESYPYLRDPCSRYQKTGSQMT